MVYFSLYPWQICNNTPPDRTMPLLTEIIFPSSLTYFDINWFIHNSLKKIVFPETLKKISKDALRWLHLESIVIPENETRIVCGCKIFNNKSHFDQSVFLPSTIETINGKKVEYTINIPSHVTSFAENCFRDCSQVRKVTCPESLEIKPDFFSNFVNLEELTLLSGWFPHGKHV